MTLTIPETAGKIPSPETWYLRVSVTDTCNLTCRYCLPGTSLKKTASKPLELSRLQNLVLTINDAIPLRKIRITGGEPLIRPGLVEMIRSISGQLPEAELSITTNGILLEQHARSLKSAGLHRINISIDSTDLRSFAALTGGGDLKRLVQGIEAAKSAGFSTIKLNSVLLKTHNVDKLGELIRFATRYQCEIRFIELMPLSDDKLFFENEYFSGKNALEHIKNLFGEVKSLGQKGTARTYSVQVEGKRIKVGFISSVSSPFCRGCDRLRLDSKGILHTCLRNGNQLALPNLEEVMDREQIRKKIHEFAEKKSLPPEHWETRQMVTIGG